MISINACHHFHLGLGNPAALKQLRNIYLVSVHTGGSRINLYSSITVDFNKLAKLEHTVFSSIYIYIYIYTYIYVYILYIYIGSPPPLLFYFFPFLLLFSDPTFAHLINIIYTKHVTTHLRIRVTNKLGILTSVYNF